MLARLRRHLFHAIEIPHDGEPALASFRELARQLPRDPVRFANAKTVADTSGNVFPQPR